MWNKLKEKFKGLNSKKLVRFVVVLVALGMIVFMTIAQIGLNDKFDFIEWLGNVLILMGIAAMFLIVGESSGYDKQREKENGVFQETLHELKALLLKIDPIKIFFAQWYNWYKPQELENKKVDFLITYGVDPRKARRIVECCTMQDLYDLKSQTKEYESLYNKDKKYIIRQLDEFEILPVTEVLKGNIRLNASSPQTFLTAYGEPNNVRLLENGLFLKDQIKVNKRINRILKFSISLVISVAWAFLTVKDFMSGDNVQAWMNLISRLLMALTSYLSGYLSSVITVKLEAEILRNKINVLTMFEVAYNKHLFPCYSEEELDKRDLEEAKRKEEEAKANIIDPEIVNESQTPMIEQKIDTDILGGK